MRLQLTPHFAVRILARFAGCLLLAVGVALLASCSREPMLPTTAAALVGDWEWTQTTTGQHTTLTPDNTGHRMSIHFDRRGRARFYQDGALVSAANFKVSRDGSGLWGPERYTITYHGYQRRQIYSLVGNGLQLEDVASQPAIHRFERALPPVITSSVKLVH
ncbi:hypothetical protein [Hymenobacter aerophilus]|uniref:hypothetical protein n=1 Tax=Hymenobacter aerophilus TaxID=119644 RepID=UPI0003815D81|nr:hypothetical protein [Hymenobacter aerophilus]